MGISNENYIVSTATQGEILVPIETELSYLNIKLLGYNAYSYHKGISQSLVNLADDIKSLQDNNQSQIEYNVDLILENAKAELDSKVEAINSDISTFIEDKLIAVTQVLTDSNNENNESIIDINQTVSDHSITINNHDNILKTHTEILGDSESGLIYQTNESDLKIATINETIGDKPIGDNPGSGLSKDIYNIEIALGDDTSGIIKTNSENKQSIIKIEKTLGDNNFGLVNIVNDINIKVNGSNNIRGYNDEIYNVSSGILARLVDVEKFSTSIDKLVLDTTTLNNVVTTINDTTLVDISSDIETLENIVGLNENLGLQKRLIDIEDLNLLVLKDNVQNEDTGLLKIVGDINSGLVKQVSLNTSNIIIHSENLLKNNTNIDKLITTIYGVNNDGIESVVNDIDNIIEKYSTFNDEAISIKYDAAKLYSMDQILEELNTRKIIEQFVNYFYDTNNANYISNDDIGIDMLKKWISDTTTTGFNSLTIDIINNYFSNNVSIKQVDTNKQNIEIITGNDSIVGSMRYLLKQSSDFLFNSTDGIITIINGSENTAGSIRSVVKEQLDPVKSDVISLNNYIKEVELQLLDNTKNNEQIEEIQVEMVRYSTILPFMQKIFKLVNDSGSITNNELDIIFNDLQNSIDTIENQEVLNDCIFTYDGTNLSVIISLDKDLTLNNVLNSTDENALFEISINNSSDKSLLFIDDSYVGQNYFADTYLGNQLFDVNDNAYNINDFTDEEIVSLKIEYSTKDIFGQNKVYSKPVKLI